ncbi:MAG TPA: Pecanex-like protein 1, partial [Actinoplanes sp.]|nr:Pecanex-like protein 1 [Actinoplanes sp.]
MRRSKYRRAASRSPKWFTGRRRLVAAAATLVAFGGIVTVTQVSDASTRRSTQRALAACDRLQAPNQSRLSTETKRGTYTTNNGRVTQHSDDGASDAATTAEVRARCRQWVMQNVGDNDDDNDNGGAPAPSTSNDTDAGENEGQEPGQGQEGQEPGGDNSGAPEQPGDDSSGAPEQPGDDSSGAPEQPGGQDGDGQDQGGDGQGGEDQGEDGDNGGQNPGTPPPGAGLGILTNSCDTSNLDAHTGFQLGDRCVSTEFGEVGAAANNPSLLIVSAPQRVAPNTPFTLQVSTRNLIRDRFLAAGQGGYYVESSVLQGGITRGHFHTACRMLSSTRQAPDPAPVPAFFVATEDRQGGRTPDTVSIQVPGLPQAGTAQC